MSTPADQVNLPYPGDYTADPGTVGIPPGPAWWPQPSGEDVNALITLPTAPPPGYVGPVPDVPGTNPPGSQQSDAGWLGAFGAMANPFFRTRRVIRATRVTNMLVRLAKIGLARVLQGVGGGTPIETTLPAIIPEAAAGAAAISTAILTVGLLFPRRLGVGPPLPGPGVPGWGNPSDLALSRQMVANERKFEQRNTTLPSVGQLDLQRQFETGGLPPGNAVRYGPQNYGRGEEMSPLERALVALYGDAIPPELRQAIESSRNPQPVAPSEVQGAAMSEGGIYLPRDAGPPLPDLPKVPAPVSSPATSSRTTNRTLPFPKIGGNAILGAGIVGAIFLAQRASGGGGGSFLAAPIAPGSTIATPPATTVSPATGIQALALGGSYGASSASCSTVPRGPRRKCLERAPVNWRSGRNKGKAAGTKCVRYAQRAS